MDKQKIKEDRAVVKLVLEECDYKINQLRLHKALFVLDFVHIGRYKSSMFNEQFVATEMGPKLEFIENHIKSNGKTIPRWVFMNAYIIDNVSKQTKGFIKENAGYVTSLPLEKLIAMTMYKSCWEKAYMARPKIEGVYCYIKRQDILKDYEELIKKTILKKTEDISLKKDLKVKL